VQRVVLTRPAVEAGGEKLGYLPGRMDEKVAPYLIPLFDSLYKALGRGRVDCHIRKGKIEIAPLAFMRGLTLEDAYIILDEAQNCTFDQLMMLLTRMGEGSRCVLTGDASQVDLEEKESGLLTMIRALRGIQGVGVYELKSSDVVRHPLVASIIDAVEAHNKGLRRIG
jgi:phosphate starvation-inducible PhoH-like protein